MPSTTADKKSFKVLWLGIFWATGLTLVVTLVSAAGLMTQLRVVLLSIFGAVCFSLAVHLHGWTKSRTQAIWQLSIIVIAMGVLGWQALPRPKLAVVEMRISPSGFPISIPPQSVISILRLHPDIILSDTNDYLFKDENTQSKEFSWPSETEIDSKDPKDYETVYRVEFINHSGEALESGKVLFQLMYNTGVSSGCRSPKEKPEFQKDFILLPQLDPGKSFDFYAINQSSSCVWLIPPEVATIRMTSDETDRQIALTLNKDPLYASGVPVFPPTKIKWEALPSRPNGYQVGRIVH